MNDDFAVVGILLTVPDEVVDLIERLWIMFELNLLSKSCKARGVLATLFFGLTVGRSLRSLALRVDVNYNLLLLVDVLFCARIGFFAVSFTDALAVFLWDFIISI